MKKYIFVIVLSILFFGCNFFEKISKEITYELPERGDYRFMFYNVENLFDTIDTPDKTDEEFLPEGGRYWGTYKYYAKLRNTAKVITAVGGWQLPDVVGLCEVENRKVVEDILKKTHLWNSDYAVLHFESPDNRGIDVAMLYNQSKIYPIKVQPIAIVFPDAPGSKTRDILYVKAGTAAGDTFHFFVNHWPSRWGGQMNSESRRVYVASVVRKTVDSIYLADRNPNIVIMGDLNDYPYNISLTEALMAERSFDDIRSENLYNLSSYLQDIGKIGSHKHDGEWGVLDQFIVSGTLLNQESKIRTGVNDVHIFAAPYLLEVDKNYTGYITNRTYIGQSYHGGYADHLPVFLDVWKNK